MNFREYIEMRERQNPSKEGGLGRLLGAGIIAGLTTAPWAYGQTDGTRTQPVAAAERDVVSEVPENLDDPRITRIYEIYEEKIVKVQSVIDHYESKAELTQQEKKQLIGFKKEKKEFESRLTHTKKYIESSMATLKKLRSGEERLDRDERILLLQRMPRLLLTKKEAYEAGFIP